MTRRPSGAPEENATRSEFIRNPTLFLDSPGSALPQTLGDDVSGVGVAQFTPRHRRRAIPRC